MADLTISNVTVVDVVNRKVLVDQEIVIKDGIIAALHPQPARPTPCRQRIVGSHSIAAPGFVNTHTHLWQHVARGIAPGGNLQQWVRKVYPLAHYLTEDELHDVTLAAASQAALSGITTIADFASVNFSEFALDATCRALTSAGLEGAVVWWNPAAFLPDDIKEAEIRRLRRTFSAHVEIWMGPGPLSFFTLPAVYDGVLLAQRLGMPITEHTAENVQEQRDLHQTLSSYMDRYGGRLSKTDREALARILAMGLPSSADGVARIKAQSRWLLSHEAMLSGPLTDQDRQLLCKSCARRTISPVPVLGLLGALPKFLSIHSVWLSPEDIQCFRRHRVTVSHNPESNMYLSSGIAPVLDLMAGGVPVTLGTDGAASNDGIDFFSAMRAMWNLQKIQTLDASVSSALTAWDVLAAATINGAAALGQGRRTGSIEVGKEADILLLRKDSLGMAPGVRDVDIVRTLVYSAGVRDVDTVLSDGVPIVRGGRLQAHRESRLAQRLTEVADLVMRRRKQGATWSVNVSLGTGGAEPYWVRRRSVRKKDSVDLRIRNAGDSPLQAVVAFSGARFGGTVPLAMHRDTLRRFPLDDPDSTWRRESVLSPGSVLTVSKKPHSWEYGVASGENKHLRTGAGAEQLLVLVRHGKH